MFRWTGLIRLEKRLIMRKIESEFIKNQYRSGLESYTNLTKEIGLWGSEKYVFQKYLNQTDRILDLGCGTGRTTFPLYRIGYREIIGVDLTPEMIEIAQELNNYFDSEISFKIGDATNLEFSESAFDVVIFSFNGLMSIPNLLNREKAVGEINRVLKKSGVFIFTTHDREREEPYFKFWEEEKAKWESGNQNPILFEYGDLITKSRNESREIFIHIPDQKEVNELLMRKGFEVIETFYRSDRFNESEQVKSKSGECRFWIAKRKTHNR